MNTHDMLRTVANDEHTDIDALNTLLRTAIREHDIDLLTFIVEKAQGARSRLQRELDCLGIAEQTARVALLDMESSGYLGLVLFDTGPNKIRVIKAVRSIVGVSLRQAKELVDRTPSLLVRGKDTTDRMVRARQILTCEMARAAWVRTSRVYRMCEEQLQGLERTQDAKRLRDGEDDISTLSLWTEDAARELVFAEEQATRGLM